MDAAGSILQRKDPISSSVPPRENASKTLTRFLDVLKLLDDGSINLCPNRRQTTASSFGGTAL